MEIEEQVNRIDSLLKGYVNDEIYRHWTEGTPCPDEPEELRQALQLVFATTEGKELLAKSLRVVRND